MLVALEMRQTDGGQSSNGDSRDKTWSIIWKMKL